MGFGRDVSAAELFDELKRAQAEIERLQNILTDIEGNCGNCKEIIRAALEE